MKNENKEGKGSKMKKALLVFASIIISIVISVMSTSFLDRFQETIDDIVNNELDSMVQDAVDSELDKLETTEPKTVSGVWYFNEQITIPESNIEQVLNFTIMNSSNEKAFGFLIYPDSALMIYTDSTLESSTSKYQLGEGDGGFWESDDDRIMDFGDMPQDVSEEFYVWLTANASEVKVVSGVWYFNEPINAPESNIVQAINFTIMNSSNEKAYGFIIGTDQSVTIYTDSTLDSSTSKYYPDGVGGGVWESDSDRTIDFGDIAQIVSEEFYIWFTANAIQQ